MIVKPLIFILLAALTLTAEASKDYYKILQVSKTATQSEIKRAYKRLSLLSHPDKVPQAEKEAASERFQQVSEAYEILSDAEKRELYDRYGEDGLKQQQGGFGGGQFRDPFDLFGQFSFGGQRNRGGQQQRKGADITMILPVSLRDLFLGKVIEVEVDKQILCPICDGSGARNADDVKTCKSCNGQGIKIMRHQIAPGMFQQVQSTCDVCGGKGKVVAAKCKNCKGTKVVRDTEILDVSIERGMKEGDIINFEGSADQQPDTSPGDINFVIQTDAHPVFTRKGDNLYMKEVISLKEALLGFQHSFEHLDGSVIELSRSSITPSGFVQTLKDYGMPKQENPSIRGKLFVEYNVLFPNQEFSAEQRKSIEKLFVPETVINHNEL